MFELPVRQGTTLLTLQTKGWSKDQWARNEAHERSLICSNFTAQDQGRGRQTLAYCSSPDIAEHLVKLINNTTVKIIVHGPVAEHNMPCPVYHADEKESAVLNLNTFVFEPSHKAHAEGWRLVKLSSWQIKLLKFLRILRA